MSADVAKAVLDRCMVDKEDKNTEKYKVEFNYEFLDDYHDLPWRERWRKKIPCCFPKVNTDEDNEMAKNKYVVSDITSDVDTTAAENAKSKRCVAAWGPPGFSPITHPLQLMVRDT